MSHPTILRGAQPARPGDHHVPPALVQLPLADAIPRLLAAIGDRQGFVDMLTGKRAAELDEKRTLRLWQPVHRFAHLVLVEAVCGVFGDPPVDRSRIRSAGAVIRLVEGADRRRWTRQSGVVEGWTVHPHTGRDTIDRYDPDPAERQRLAPAANRRVFAAAGLRLDQDDREEVSFPLFPAPPAVCAALGKTVLYGMVPTASSDQAPPDPQPPFDDEFLAGGIPNWLRAAPKTPPALAGVSVDAAGVETALPTVRDFIDDLNWVAQGCGLGTDSSEAAALRTALDGISLVWHGPEADSPDTTEGLGAFLERAQQVLVERRTEAGTLTFPDVWTLPTGAQETALRAKIIACFTARWTAMAPGRGRYEDESARYVLSAFLRYTDDCACPHIHWTEETEPFAIVPWYEGSGTPPVRINLPDLNPAGLRKLKPNVAFAMPPDLRKTLDALDLKGLLDGKKPNGKLEFGMICSFSIPIITLCAFIVLYIFLGLLNIVFWWLAWIKICIPYPKKI